MQFSDGIFCSFSLSLLSPIAEVQLCQYTCWVLLLLLSVMTAAAACRNSFSPFIIFFSTVCPSFVSHSLSQSVRVPLVVSQIIANTVGLCRWCRCCWKVPECTACPPRNYSSLMIERIGFAAAAIWLLQDTVHWAHLHLFSNCESP